MELERQWIARSRDRARYHEQAYERLYWDLYGEPWRLSVTWISSFDTTAGRAFLNRKE